MPKADYEMRPFKTQKEWRMWLDKHHTDTDGVWVQIYKKAAGLETISYAEALDMALCYGWIDGQKRSVDDMSYAQKFTPRRTKSMWSKRNREHVARLAAAGLMMPTGIAEVDRAKEDGRWADAYDASSSMTPPDYFIAELQKHPKAKQFYETLNKTNTYAISWRLRTAKTEATRKRRLEKIIEMLNAGQKLH